MSTHEWQAPGPDDKRSPCPALNALANHGYLPRSGENITPSMLVKALQEGLNASNLDDLNQHNKVEHDCSLTRKDFYFGDNHTVDPELVDLLLEQNIDGKINVEALSKLHWIRLNHSKEFNPTLVYNNSQKFTSAGEVSLLLNFFGGNTNHEIDIEKLEIFLKSEKFPNGWRKPDKVVGIWSLISILRSTLTKYDQLEKDQKEQRNAN
ncbi:17347_t:CDS:2 [Gigaspora margarita]|uniref:17347_t:CDS:1 n=1 Tax=Gigaspora margarita TaxID=4874 RepID=A0ABN7UIC3_GIGMA|nr:17347_t:CDS:2 [Gigaspora margarita]